MTIGIVGVGDLADATIARLRELDQDVEIIDSNDLDRGAVAHVERCVLAVDSIEIAFCLTVNQACIDAGILLIPGLGMGPIVQVGPAIVAGECACLQCVDIRVRTALGRPGLAGPITPEPAILERAGRVLAELTTSQPRDSAGRLTYLWADGRNEQHRVLRYAGCPACHTVEPLMAFATAAELDVFGGPEADRERILGLEPLLVDPLMGIVPSTRDYDPKPHEPQIKHHVAMVADPCLAGQPITAGGNALDADHARAGALGEALDRIATSNPHPDSLRIARYADVREDAVDPATFDLFDAPTRSRDGFPFANVGPDVERSWVWAWSMGHQRPLMVPASRVFIPMIPVAEGDMTDHDNLSGCATGSSRADATLGGLLEVIERDSFMIAWLNQLPVTGLRLATASDAAIIELCALFDDVEVEVRCSMIELGWGVKTVFAMAKPKRDGDPAVVVAAAADRDLAIATRRALTELTANLSYVRNVCSRSNAVQSADRDAVRTQDAHARLYARADMSTHLDSWWAPVQMASIPPVDKATSAEQLHRISNAMIRDGLDVLIVDLTMPEMAKAEMFTYKVLVPGTYPVNFDELWPHHGGERLAQAPVDAGILRTPVSIDQRNPVPHPFP